MLQGQRGQQAGTLAGTTEKTRTTGLTRTTGETWSTMTRGTNLK